MEIPWIFHGIFHGDLMHVLRGRRSPWRGLQPIGQVGYNQPGGCPLPKLGDPAGARQVVTGLLALRLIFGLSVPVCPRQVGLFGQRRSASGTDVTRDGK